MELLQSIVGFLQIRGELEDSKEVLFLLSAPG